MEGIITKINKELFTVLVNNLYVECVTRGKLRNNNIFLTVGDRVVICEKTKTIESLLERKNTLKRPLVSNVDKLLIIVSTKIPKFSSLLLDKFIVIAKNNNIEPVIILTKMDLLDRLQLKNIKKYIKYYKKLGFKVYKNSEINKIKKEFVGKIVALTGQTGAGKSTLLNRIDKNLLLKTDEISISLGRGKHTTRIVELLEINGGLVADTPGFSSITIENISKESLFECYLEFDKSCKYKTCTHTVEDGCILLRELKTCKDKILLERYKNYKKILNELE